ncbi:hypothetical protein ES288_A10G157900v1 [Gossypium darwinii]|nr:hypothetical protein ES288_A10G157900v1 [Gossypium darwinii]TYI06401.1 hypothetical protein ES332_A10G156800v1 [Gossypium tomentosum]
METAAPRADSWLTRVLVVEDACKGSESNTSITSIESIGIISQPANVWPALI